MNIALCHESVLPRKGGCETYIASLARRLVADGHEVHLYARQHDPQALPGDLRHHRIAGPPLPRFLRPWHFSAACARALRQADHDVSVGFDKVAGVDVLYPQGGVYAVSVELNLQKHTSVFLRRLLRAIKSLDPAHQSFLALERRGLAGGRTMVLAISDMVRRHLQDHHAVAPENIRLLPIAAPPERLDEADRPRRRQEARQRWGLTGVTALFAGMNYRLKGLVPLLHALAQLRPLSLDVLVAGEPRTAAFERLARRLGVADHVRFLGYCRDMRDAYFAADLLVHPTFYDPCANVVLEALTCGLPVITSRHNGAAELLRPVGGERGDRAEGIVIDDPHDHAELAAALQALLDPGRRSACASAARRNAEGWTFERHYAALVEVLGEAARRKRQAA
jgi:UDP-glucose:(heptosyl)LPS alpha-1,3-glucosyltransferase